MRTSRICGLAKHGLGAHRGFRSGHGEPGGSLVWGANIDDLGEEHGRRVLTVRGEGSITVLVSLPPAVASTVEGAVALRAIGPLLVNRYGSRMDRQAATRRLTALAQTSRMRRTECTHICSDFCDHDG